jgi:hypothetical protein
MYNPYQLPFQQQQTQQTGLISVRSELEARNYPIAPGNSVTFKDETAPYVYTKTMGFSQLDMPVFEKYRLVKEEEQASVVPDIREELAEIRTRLEALEKPKTRKKEVIVDEQ